VTSRGAAYLLLAAAALGAACTSRTPPRNVVLITLDTMRADRLPAYGFDAVATPALDRLAAEGAVFERAFAAVPLTLPSHATLFTGLYPPRLSVYDNAGAPLGAEAETLAEVLASRGLATAAFVSSAVIAPGRGLEQGFDTYSLGKPSCPGPARVRRPAQEVVDESLDWLEGHGSSPFFVWMHFYDTHAPIQVPVDFALGYADPYLAAIAYEDAQIARVVEYLERRGLLEDSLIVVTADHGESLGDHGEEAHGLFLYDEALRVPLIVRGPGIAPARVPGAVRLIDVMPTVLEFFGRRMSSVEGVSFAALMSGADEAPREVYAESRYPERFGWANLRALRMGRWKVVDAPQPELYDVVSDPGELRNLYHANHREAARLLDRLQAGYAQPEAASTAPVVDRALASRLASLGYVAGSPRPTKSGSAPADPKTMIETFNHITRGEAAKAAAPGRGRMSGC
jgi:arylsulfatase A-like enzyme